MSEERPSDHLSEVERRVFLKRMIALGFAVPVVTSFEPSDAAADHKPKHKKKTTTTTSTTLPPTTAPPTTAPPTTTAVPTTSTAPTTSAAP
jgi:hypothetical protein